MEIRRRTNNTPTHQRSETHKKLTARNTEPVVLVGKSGLQTLPTIQRGYFVQIT
jgi:hypothetical protein